MIWSGTGTYPAGDTVRSALESSERVTDTQDDWVIFAPAKENGNRSDLLPRRSGGAPAYAPVLHRIANQGVLVVIVPMPLNLAILNTAAAEAVIETYPAIETWTLAGLLFWREILRPANYLFLALCSVAVVLIHSG